jgi:hypothetical protein
MSNMQSYSEQRDRAYVLLIDAQPVLAFGALNLPEARQLGRESWLLEDLRELKSNGAPVLAGTPKVTVRAATPEEAAIYAKVAAEPRVPEGELVLAFLIELDDDAALVAV